VEKSKAELEKDLIAIQQQQKIHSQFE